MPSQKLDDVFESNPNKDFLRSNYDKPLVAQWSNARGKLLRYLGLPAWQMLDIIEWQEFLNHFTTIEREEDQQHLMFLRANVKDLEHRLYALYGEFDTLLVTGRDSYGQTPKWPYDVINLDYFGGFLYPDLSRPKALKKLIENQSIYETSFILFVTQHLRDRDSIGEKAAFLGNLGKWLKNSTYDTSLHSAIDGVIDWYLNATLPDAARQALYMNFFFRDSAEGQHFNVKCRPPIIYSGSGGSCMIHFATDFYYQPGMGHRVASDQSLVELINLGLREVREGQFISSRIVQPTL